MTGLQCCMAPGSFSKMGRKCQKGPHGEQEGLVKATKGLVREEGREQRGGGRFQGLDTKDTMESRRGVLSWNATPRSLPSLERNIRSRTHA